LEEVKAMENYATWGVAESAIKVSEWSWFGFLQIPRKYITHKLR
jgi:hypothetical protein